ncbi:MAG: DEAD/DEAH box helicase [Acidobacteria bacterium]|nr:DEAD/DEAH box helicase [Acidobacteriota bacterium]
MTPPSSTALALLAPVLTPRGHLLLTEGGEPPGTDRDVATRLLDAFSRGSGEGLLQLGAGEVGTTLSPVLAYWRDFATQFVTAICAHPDAHVSQRADNDHAPDDAAAGRFGIATPEDVVLSNIVAAAPPMAGAEYLTTTVLRSLWGAIETAFARRIATTTTSIQDALQVFNPAWNTVGRVCFHLAENRKDPEAPFAFLATYTHGLSAQAKPQHLPLGQALREYAGAANKTRLLSLLLPVQRAAERCAWLKSMVDQGEIFHPLRWTPREAVTFLRDVEALEQAGVVVRVPANWKSGRPPRPQVTATVGAKAPGGLGLDALLDFQMEVTLDGEPLTPAEIRAVLDGVEGLALLRGKWVEVDRERLRGMIDQFRRIDRAASTNGVTFAEAMRLLAGTGAPASESARADGGEWAGVVAGPWLAHTLQTLSGPEALARINPGTDLRGTLRPYQQVGLRWLHLLSSLGLGACLADDMGLGKTIQVLALLLVLKRHAGSVSGDGPSLLVAPASLLANWAAEIARFAPTLTAIIAHPSAMLPDELKSIDQTRLRKADVVITSYGSVRALPWLAVADWNMVIIDEAQAIKNPEAKQTRAVKALHARTRIALTGTPIENRLGDLWSIFDFINPGLLGSAKQFTALTKRLADRPHNAYGPLRELVRPYILRRLKTDASVISDLPEKTEVNAYALLSRKQAALYEQALRDLRDGLERADGMARRGLVLASLMRLKQICNHPSQWLGDGAWNAADSGKWARLTEIAEVVAARQQKVLIFTQFREITAPLAAHLGTVFGRPGLVLHGGTPVRARRDLVTRFQDDETVPFFVLSLKAGGSGLNLTAASHVVHFDRWWNPAVEDQATDRAFRIGQTRNVLVHKFVCRGTVEERIDELIASKRGLARDLLEGGGDLLLTEMNNEELLRLVALDVNAALKEG